MLAGISAGYHRDLAGLQLGWRRLLLRRPSSHETGGAAFDHGGLGADVNNRSGSRPRVWWFVSPALSS